MSTSIYRTGYPGRPQRLNRRRLLGATALLGGTAAMGVAGCSSSTKPSGPATATSAAVRSGSTASAAASPQAAAPQKGGTVTFSLNGEPENYDPHYSGLTPHVASIVGVVYDSLMNVDADSGNLLPNLITKWEFADPTTLNLTIRDGVKFHDKPPASGRVMTAQDVAYSLNRARQDDPKVFYHTRLAAIDSVAAPDPKTVQIKLKNPSASLLITLSAQVVVNKESIEAISGGVIKDPRQAIGTGPFICTDFQVGSSGKTTRNPNYWDAGRPYLDGINWIFIKDPQALIAAYRTGDADFVTGGGVSETSRKQLAQSNPAMQFLKVAVDRPGDFLTDLSKTPFSDQRVRKAVDLVVDRQSLVQVVLGSAGVPCGPIWDGWAPGFGFPDAELAARPGFRQPKDQDLTDAKSLLAAAGFANGLDLPAEGSETTGYYNLDPTVASVAQFAKVGIKLHVDKTMDITTYLDTQLKGNYLFRSGAITSGTPDPGDQLRIRYHSSSPRSYTHYKNPDVDKIIDSQDALLQAEERKAAIVKVQRTIMDDIPIVHTFWVWNYLPIQPTLHGMKVSALTTGIPIWKDVWRSKA